MLNRPISKSSKLEMLGAIVTIIIAAVLLPMVKAEKPGKNGVQVEAGRAKVVDSPLEQKKIARLAKVDDMQQLIDSALPGATIIVPKGLYTNPVRISKSVTLKGKSRIGCIFEVTANEPAISIDTKGKGLVTLEDLTIKWQLATSDKNTERPFALGIKDSKTSVKNCRFVPLGDFRRSPVAVRAEGFSQLDIGSCRFEGFEYVICYGPGTKGKTENCLILDCGHQGVINYSGSTLRIERNVITGSRYHAIRSTGGILYVQDNLIINNANRGLYLGNKSARGTITNNVIMGNGTGIGGFARSRFEVRNNILANSSYAGIGMYQSCSLRIQDNIFIGNERGWVMFEKGDKGDNTAYRNTFWQNKVDAENFQKTANSIETDPSFVDPENGNFSLRPGPVKEHNQGLTDSQIFKTLWKIWKNRKDKNEPFASKIERHSERNDARTEDSPSKKVDYSAVTVKEGIGFDDIAVGNPDCRKEFVRSKLGTPDEEMGRWLSYKQTFGLDFWFGNNGILSEIRLNPGFRGQLIGTGISLASSKREVFVAYGEPLEEKEIDDLHRKNHHRVLYKKENITRIYYEDTSLIFWFNGDRINQIVTFPKQ